MTIGRGGAVGTALAAHVEEIVPQPLQMLRRRYIPRRPAAEEATIDGARCTIERHYCLVLRAGTGLRVTADYPMGPHYARTLRALSLDGLSAVDNRLDVGREQRRRGALEFAELARHLMARRHQHVGQRARAWRRPPAGGRRAAGGRRGLPALRGPARRPVLRDVRIRLHRASS